MERKLYPANLYVPLLVGKPERGCFGVVDTCVKCLVVAMHPVMCTRTQKPSLPGSEAVLLWYA
jgi:hypothetical protein